ncbi:DUF4111 domain-containing protein [Microbacterium sp. ET2]|uniref:aminoglycoside adenylyltransferase domain-containing protein n=1 Tax=Microbacterium albipurpureum TaxID=3050384 RepID=UPI00259CB97C|nr:aminoglycoside adenylyltransferase domain-containing protein [Microbacterium sp. ET2 (Ac-2212)]WJL94961.1 DUF4111 domain-containing protein [Microbacterium sp. ET2 (Ac-2212)]
METDSERVERLAEVIAEALERTLVSLILYGSAVSGGLRPDSDIDLLAVVSHALDPSQRERLVDGLLRTSGRRAFDGPARPVELTVIVTDHMREAEPVVQFQYGEWLRDDATAGRLAGPHVDHDVILLMAMARDSGHALRGVAPEDCLPEPSRGAVRAAITATLPALLGDLTGDERNVILTLARMLVTVREGRFVPKDAAAERIARAAPEEQNEMLRIAAAAYRGEVDDDWTSLQMAMRAFVADAASEIAAAGTSEPLLGHSPSAPLPARVVTTDHEIPDRPPLIVEPGDTVEVGDRDAEWPAFVFVTTPRGSGWVPARHIQIDGRTGVVLVGYDTTELPARAGGLLHVIRDDPESGWAWCRDDAAREGWVPHRVLAPPA